MQVKDRKLLFIAMLFAVAGIGSLVDAVQSRPTLIRFAISFGWLLIGIATFLKAVQVKSLNKDPGQN
jgi:hypothetical protein